MAAPSTPTLSLARLSPVSFRATVDGDPGVTHRLFYRRLVDGTDYTGPTRIGDGDLDVGNLTALGQYLVWAVSDSAGELSFPALGFISLASQDTVLTAVRTRWNLNPTLFPVAGKLYSGEVPEIDETGKTVQVPYSFVEVGRSHFSWTTESLYFETCDLEFVTFCPGAENAEKARAEIESVFAWRELPFNDPALASTISVAPTDYKLDAEHVRYTDGRTIYRAQLCFQVSVERHLAHLFQP